MLEYKIINTPKHVPLTLSTGVTAWRNIKIEKAKGWAEGNVSLRAHACVCAHVCVCVGYHYTNCITKSHTGSIWLKPIDSTCLSYFKEGKKNPKPSPKKTKNKTENNVIQARSHHLQVQSKNLVHEANIIPHTNKQFHASTLLWHC